MSVESPGRKAVLQCTSDLTSLLKHNLSCSGKLLEKGLITEAVHNYVLTAQGVSAQEKAARLVSCLADRVGASSQVFHELIEALKETDPFCADVVDKLTSLHSSFNALRMTTEEEKKQVGSTIKRLEKQFSSLQRRLSSELNANGELSPEILLESLTLLPIALRNEYEKIIFENLSTLEKANSIRKLFHHLNPLSSFIDYHLIEYLVEEFGSEQLQEDMSAYVKLVQVFYDETTVQQLMDHCPGRRDIPPHFEELTAVIDEDPGTYTLRRLDNLRKEFCTEIRLFETVLILKRFGRKNSFVVCWVVPSIFVPQLTSVIGSLRSFYQREHIFSVTVGRQRLYSIAAEYEERLLFLCSNGTGDISKFQYLLSQPGLDTNIYDKDGYTPLYYASSHRKNDLIRLLLEHGAEVDLPTDDEWGSTPLTAACVGGHVTTAALLIEKKATVNYINKKGHHPLYTASFSGELECAKLLLDHSAQIDLPTNNDLGSTALGIACQQGHVHVARLLIDRGAAIDYQNKDGVTALSKASEKGHTAVVELLLIHGAKTDIHSNEGVSPLFIASQNGYQAVVELLLIHGAKTDVHRNDGVSPLYKASEEGHNDVVQLLLDSGASVDLPTKNEYCFTALGIACELGKIEVAKTLIDNGADVNYQSKDEWTPLLSACNEGYIKVVELLIKCGAQLDTKIEEGRTALSLACYKGHSNIVQILVQSEANTDVQDQEGLTALMLATQKGHVEVVKILLNGKADPNITDKTSSWTAIFFAIEQNNLEIIELLIRGGAKLDIKDKNGLTAFEVAKTHNQQAVCDLLEKHGSKTTEKEITQEQKEQVKASSQRLKRVLNFLERTLLREKTKKKEQQQPDKGGISSNILQRRREKQLAKKMKGMTVHTDTTTKFVS